MTAISTSKQQDNNHAATKRVLEIDAELKEEETQALMIAEVLELKLELELEIVYEQWQPRRETGYSSEPAQSGTPVGAGAVTRAKIRSIVSPSYT